jgi:hypothetical protein
MLAEGSCTFWFPAGPDRPRQLCRRGCADQVGDIVGRMGISVPYQLARGHPVQRLRGAGVDSRHCSRWQRRASDVGNDQERESWRCHLAGRGAIMMGWITSEYILVPDIRFSFTDLATW